MVHVFDSVIGHDILMPITSIFEQVKLITELIFRILIRISEHSTSTSTNINMATVATVTTTPTHTSIIMG